MQTSTNRAADFVESRTRSTASCTTPRTRPSLMKIVEELRGTVGRYLLGVRVSDKDHDQHQRLAQLVALEDADKAASWLVRHLRAVGESLEKMLDESSPDVVTTTGAPLAAMSSLSDDPPPPTTQRRTAA